MDLLVTLPDLLAHLDRHLIDLVVAYGPWVYGVLFVIVAVESSVVPGVPIDALLFTAGMLATDHVLHVHGLFGLFVGATLVGVLGSFVLGRALGPTVFKENRRYFDLERLARSQSFFAAHGGRMFLVARFIPVIRTFAPLIAGMARMHTGAFLFFNLIGAVLWVAFFVYGGYFFGELPVVRAHFTEIVFGVFVVSFLPLAFDVWRVRRRARTPQRAARPRNVARLGSRIGTARARRRAGQQQQPRG